MGRYRIISKEGLKSKYAYGIRDDGGYILFFKKVEYYQGQDSRFKKEMQESWTMALMILLYMNDLMKK